MIDRFVVVPAAYVYLLRPASPDPHDGDGAHDGREVLLQLRRGTGYMDEHWAAVAGHVEQGESVQEAARREALEEVDVTDLDLEPWCAMQRTGQGDPIDERVDYFFTSTSWSGTPRIVEPRKCAELRWWPLDRLPDPVVPHERFVLDSIRAGATPSIVTYGF